MRDEDGYPTDPDFILRNRASAIAYFKRRKLDFEEHLRRFQSIPGFRIVERVKISGHPDERDITGDEIKRLEHGIRDFERVIDALEKLS